MKKVVLNFILCFFIVNNIHSQSFDRFSAQIMDTLYSIDCKLPKDFIDLKTNAIFHSYDKNADFLARVLGMSYCPVIQSLDEHCMVMYYPSYLLKKHLDLGKLISGKEKNRNIQHRNQMNSNLKVIAGSDVYKFDKYVTIWSQDRSRSIFNADSVFTFNIPVPSKQPYKEIYTKSMAMYITKYDRAYIAIIWFFTKNGYKNRQKYIDAFCKTIWYKDEWTPDEEKIQKVRWNGYCNDSHWE